MVCDRCIMVVQDIFKQLNIAIERISLGEVTVKEKLSENQMESLKAALENVGFDIIDGRRSQLIEQIKTIIRELVHRKESDLKINLSSYLTEKLHLDYSRLTSLFSEVEGTTIEKYFIALKIERVKELLIYDHFTINEIAHQLNYSSAAHLSNQFKKVTGLTPSYYKQLGDKRRKPLDKV